MTTQPNTLKHVEVCQPNNHSIKYQDTIICDNPNIEDILDKSFGNNKIYDLNGQVLRRPKGIYIENGKIKYINNLK